MAECGFSQLAMHVEEDDALRIEKCNETLDGLLLQVAQCRAQHKYQEAYQAVRFTVEYLLFVLLRQRDKKDTEDRLAAGRKRTDEVAKELLNRPEDEKALTDVNYLLARTNRACHFTPKGGDFSQAELDRFPDFILSVINAVLRRVGKPDLGDLLPSDSTASPPPTGDKNADGAPTEASPSETFFFELPARRTLLKGAGVLLIITVVLGLFIGALRSRTTTVESARQKMQAGHMKPTLALLIDAMKSGHDGAALRTLLNGAIRELPLARLDIRGVRSAAFHPSRQELITAGRKGLHVWNAGEKKISLHVSIEPHQATDILAVADDSITLVNEMGRIRMMSYDYTIEPPIDAGELRSAQRLASSRELRVDTAGEVFLRDVDNEETLAALGSILPFTQPVLLRKKKLFYMLTTNGLEARDISTGKLQDVTPIREKSSSRLIQVGEGFIQRALSHSIARQNELLVSADGKYAIVKGPNHRFRVIDVKGGGEVLQELPIETTVMAFLDEDDAVVAGDTGGRVRVFSKAGRDAQTTSNAGARAFADRHTAAVTELRIKRRSGEVRVLTASADGTAALWDERTGEILQRFHHGAPLLQADLSADGSLVFTLDRAGYVAVWQVSDWGRAQTCGPLDVVDVSSSDAGTQVVVRCLPEYMQTHASFADQIDCVTGLFDEAMTMGHRVAVAGYCDDQIIVATSRDGVALRFEAHSKVRAMALSQGGSLLAIHDHRQTDSTVSGEILLGQIPYQRSDDNWPPPPEASALDIATMKLSPNGRLMVTTSTAGRTALWGTSPKLHFLQSLSGTAPRFSASGRQVVTIEGASALLWDDTGCQIGRLSGHPDRIHAAFFHANGTEVVTVLGQGELWRWDLTSQKPVGAWHIDGNVSGTSMSPDGRLLTGAQDGSVHVRDGYARPLLTLRKPNGEGAPKHLVFLADDRAVSVSPSGIFRFYDVTSAATTSVESVQQIAEPLGLRVSGDQVIPEPRLQGTRP